MDLPTICPRCMEDSRIQVQLHDPDEPMHCESCDEEFTMDAVKHLIETWGPLIAWLDSHPARQQQ